LPFPLVSSWKVDPDNVRTLAKAVWKAGVGVWIDVVKLCPVSASNLREVSSRIVSVALCFTQSLTSRTSALYAPHPLPLIQGDEIRPMVRTTVRRVHKVIIFLCDEYCRSPNCCVEMMEAIQHPEKCTVCIIKDNVDPEVMKFLLQLTKQGLRM
jgi:hypothetical protein